MEFIHVCGYRYPVDWEPNSMHCRVMAGHIAGSFHRRKMGDPDYAGIVVMPESWWDKDGQGEYLAHIPERTPEYREETFLHELIHAIEFELIESGELSKESEEGYIDAVSRALYRSLKGAGIWTMPQPTGQLRIRFPELEMFGEIVFKVGMDARQVRG